MGKLKKVLKEPVALYGIGILFFIFFDEALIFALNIISDIAFYNIFNPFINYGRIIVFRSLFFLPVLLAVLLADYVFREKSNVFSVISRTMIHILGCVTLFVVAGSCFQKTLYVKSRYDHVVKYRYERFDTVPLTAGDFRYSQNGVVGYNFGYSYVGPLSSEVFVANNKIIYIYDEQNPDKDTDGYIKKLISEQPLIIYTLEKKQAAEVMLHNAIEQLPAVLMVVDYNNDVMEGYKEISMLETKIHNYKQHNIYFY